MSTRPAISRLVLLGLLLPMALLACVPQEPMRPPAVDGTPAAPSTEPAPAASATEGAPIATEAGPASPEGAQPPAAPLPPFTPRALPVDYDELFATSGVCALCHTQMIDVSGNDVSIDALWRASMMANAARDPYWQASVRGELLDHPAAAATIEDKCARCHTPMAHTSATQANREASLLDGGFLATDHPQHTFAADGVSCTACHQIQDEGLGEPASFTGGFVIDPDSPMGQRAAFGPFQPLRNAARPMQRHSGFLPTEGLHVLDAELCGTCHTLYTPVLDENGQAVGVFPEQVPYLEWQHSDYAADTACQDCHMPPADGGVRLATMGPSPARSPIGQHRFVGGNAYVLQLIWLLGDDLRVTAAPNELAEKIARTEEQIETRTATLDVEEAALDGGTLTLAVTVRNQAGHKLPTGYPSRRAWLHVTVRDAAGTLLFESGASSDTGEIAGNDNDADPGAFEPHYQEITAPDQVQIYEAILENAAGEVTTGLMEATAYRKDNRLLPAGFDKASADADIAVYGQAAADDDFTGGTDRITYRIDVSDAAPDAALTVTIALRYQSISHRWADNLRRHDAPEVSRFLETYETLPNHPLTIASLTQDVEP